MGTKRKLIPSKGAVALKHARVLRNMVENGGNSGKRGGLSAAARQAGYSEAYIKSGKLQKTKAWDQLVQDMLSDELLTSVHKGLLTHKEWRARDAGLDKAYKIKRKYDNTINIKGAITQLSDSEIEDRIAELVSGTLGSLAGAGQTSEK